MPKPVNAEELVEEAESLWRDVAPHPQATIREIDQTIGAVQVVRWLRGKLLANDDEAPTVYPPSFNTGRD